MTQAPPNKNVPLKTGDVFNMVNESKLPKKVVFETTDGTEITVELPIGGKIQLKAGRANTKVSMSEMAADYSGLKRVK